MHLPAETAGFRQYGQYTAGIFSNLKKGAISTNLLVDTVYTGRTGLYGTKFTSLLKTSYNYTITK